MKNGHPETGDWSLDGDFVTECGDECGPLAKLDREASPFAGRFLVDMHNETVADLRRMQSALAECVDAIEQWADGTSGWSTRLRASQEVARPILARSKNKW